MSLFSERKPGHCPDKLCYQQNIPVLNKAPKKEKLQVVPPFSIQSLRRRNVVVEPFNPKERISMKPYPVGNTLFRKCYERGDFPIIMVFDPSLGQKIAWKVNIKEIDYQYYLPVFFNGLCEIEYPYNFYAQQGIEDLLYFGGKQKVLPVVPQLILPIKNALNTRNRSVIGQTLKIIQAMLSCVRGIGVALVPYYRQILPPLNIYKEMNANTGQEIDYGQQKRENIGELVQETLELLERHGGDDAYINIKVVPHTEVNSYRTMPIKTGIKKQSPPIIVPPFSIQAHRHRNVIVEPFDSKKNSLTKPYPIGNTVFRRHYERGDFPIAMEFDQTGRKVAWKVNISEIDYAYYLPLFFNGLCEVEYPYSYFAQEGVKDLLLNGKKKVLPVIPQFILPIKNALNTKNRTIIAATLKILQVLVSNSETIGEALVPYYRQILPPLNLYKSLNGADIDYSQQKRENIGELVQETLEMLETYGGKDAFINIKYMVPTYESCIQN